jgi:hypothetical protein
MNESLQSLLIFSTNDRSIYNKSYGGDFRLVCSVHAVALPMKADSLFGRLTLDEP